MQSSFRILLPAFAAALLCAALLTGPCSAAPSDHPVVYGIIGPKSLDNGYGPTGSYTFTATVAGGSPPYTYKWMNPAGVKTLFEGKEYASVTIPANQLYTGGGPGHYGVWLTVTDSAGKKAVWQRDGGVGNSDQFFYGITYTDSPSPGWTTLTEPKTFPVVNDAPVPTEVVTTMATCVDSNARFSGVSGQVEVSHTGMDDTWKIPQIDTPLCEGDWIKTDEDASCILSFADMSTFVLKPESTIILAKTSGPQSKMKMVAGNIWTNIKKMVKDGSMEVETSQAICGIRGTTFVLSTDATGTTLQVIEGTVAMTGKADGKITNVSTGQQLTATSAGLGTPTTFNTAAVQADWDGEKAQAASGTPAAKGTQKSPVGIAPALAALAGTGLVLVLRRN